MKRVTEEWLKAAADDLRVIEKISSDDYLTHMVPSILSSVSKSHSRPSSRNTR